MVGSTRLAGHALCRRARWARRDRRGGCSGSSPAHRDHPRPVIVERAAADVMRGEEVQLLGAVAAGLAPADALLVPAGHALQMGTMADGRYRRLHHGDDRRAVRAAARRTACWRAARRRRSTDGAAFREGVEDGRRRDLAARPVRHPRGLPARPRDDERRGILCERTADRQRRRGAPRRRGRDEVYVLADPVLGALYGAAIEALGGRAHLVDSHAAFVAGIIEPWRN